MTHIRLLLEDTTWGGQVLECTCGKSFGDYSTAEQRDQADLAFHRHEIEVGDNQPEAA